jgi:hypothetical protein
VGRTLWRIVGMVALGLGGLVVALALTLGALALASDDAGGGSPAGIELMERPSTGATPSRDDPARSPSPRRSESPSDDDIDGDHGYDDPSDDGSGSDDHHDDDD